MLVHLLGLGIYVFVYTLWKGWLQPSSDTGAITDEEIEPPVPAGLGQLSASLSSFAEFLQIDTDLIDWTIRLTCWSGLREPT
jgi:hypothetical protein